MTDLLLIFVKLDFSWSSKVRPGLTLSGNLLQLNVLQARVPVTLPTVFKH